MKQRIIKIAKWTGISLVSIFLLITLVLYVFKDNIIGAVITEVNKYLKTEVKVAEVDLSFWSSFPNLSVDFEHVFIRDSYQGSTDRDTLLYTDRIRLKFNPADIWREEYRVKKIEIEPGTLQLKVNRSGEVNYDIVKPSEDTTAAAPFKFELEKVSCENLRFSYDNRATQQRYVTHVHDLQLSGNFTEKQFDLQAESQLKINKAKSGEITLLSNREATFDLRLKVDQEKGSVELPEALVYISNLPFAVKGKVDPKGLDFNIQSNDIQLTDLATNFAVTEVDEIRKFNGKGTVYFDLDIEGKNEATSPVVIDCSFGINEGELTEPESRMSLRNIHLDGEYSNRGGSEKEFLQLKDMRFNTIGGPFSGELLLTRFKAPRFQGRAVGNIDMNVVHRLFHIPYVETTGGNVLLRTNFDIKAEPQEDESLDYAVNKLEGDLELKGLHVKLLEDKRDFRDLYGRLYLRNDEAGIEHVRLAVGKTDIEVNGVFRNIVNYLKSKGELNANVQLKSNNIDVADLGTTTKEEKIQDGRQYILPPDIVGSVFMEVGNLQYEGHDFKQFKGNLLVGNRTLHFPSLSLKNAGADINGNLTIEERTPEIFHVITNIATPNLQFKQLFREWNNFRQDVIGENNISGKAQAKVYLEAPFDLRSGVISKSIRSEIHIKVLDGRLKDVEAFKSITDNLRTSNAAKLAIGPKHINSLERKLLDLKFETLENTLIIRNGSMEIPKMTILSNALDIDLTGTHSFEDVIDYRFAFRFRDLKDQQKDLEFGEVIDDGTGMRVYMRMYGPLDDPTIVWDKQAKKDQAKENREKAKEDARSILKTEFGFYKNDTTVKIYQEPKKQKETLHIEFGTNETDPVEIKKPEKDSKLKNKLNKLKEQSEKERQKEVEFEVD